MAFWGPPFWPKQTIFATPQREASLAVLQFWRCFLAPWELSSRGANVINVEKHHGSSWLWWRNESKHGMDRNGMWGCKQSDFHSCLLNICMPQEKTIRKLWARRLWATQNAIETWESTVSQNVCLSAARNTRESEIKKNNGSFWEL